MKLYKHLIVIAISMSILSCKKSADTGATGKTMLNISYGASAEQKMDIYLPANRNNTSTKVLVMIHGGAWNSGDKSELTPYADSIRKRLTDYAVFNINYRLATGSNLFPAQEDDVKSAIQFIINKSGVYEVSKKFVLLGVSAGAHLALLQGYKHASQVNPKAIVSFFGQQT